MRLVLPKLYVILDAALLTQPERQIARDLAEAGVTLIQYRNKTASARELFKTSRILADELRPCGVTFFVNDRPDVAALSGADGVHVGQEDLGVEQARVVVGAEKWIGVSTHNEQQFRDAIGTSADYVAIGPIFETSTKADPDPVVGIELVRRMRRLTEKPVVAIGGITLEWAVALIEAGADSVAVVGDILKAKDPAIRAQQYVEKLG